MPDALKLLVIEDEMPDFLMLQRHLREQGLSARCHRVESAEGLSAALEQSGWDVVLSDFRVPGMNFRETFEQVRARAPGLPVILVSGSVGEEEAVELLKMGLSDFVLKDGLPRLVPAIQRALHELSERRAREEAERALRESEGRYRRIVETATEGISFLDAELRVTFANGAFARMLGYTPEEMIGTPVEQYTFPEEFDESRKHMDARRRGVVEQYERHLRRKNGTGCWCLNSGRPILDSDGRFAGSFGMFTDITERRQLEEQLRQSQKMEAIGQLAGGVAHDFNNLLTVISGNSELLLLGMAPENPLRTHVADIRHAGERAAGLTRQLLAFSRKQLLEPRVLDLNEVVSGIEKMLRRLIGEDIVLTSILSPDLRPVKIDPGQVEQVILNIAVNARDAMPQGGRLTIETRNLQDGNTPLSDVPSRKTASSVLLSISDTGCGMTPEVKAHVFEPFFTTKGPGKGTGLGLATVYGIVEQSGGGIAVRSEPDAGTTFEILLPAVAEAPAAARSGANHKAVPHGHETVLIVEDEEAVRRIVKLVLDSSGYTVLEAKDGQQALEIAKEHRGHFHLLVTDVVMPGMSGRQLVELLRADIPALRVLFISGYTDDTVMRHGIVDGRESFLQKPFSPLALARKVREVLDVGL
jgi:two-component system, cell cycle sensor histidine kinase and response regulator CckA